MKTGSLWLQKQCILLARYNGGSPLEYLREPLCRLGRWIQATNELYEEKQKKPPEKIPLTLKGEKAEALFGLTQNK